MNFKYESVPTFCLLYGVIGHSEKFWVKLFEEQSNVKQIGAKWLRNGAVLSGLAGSQEEGGGGIG